MQRGDPDPTPVVLLHGWGGSYADTWQGSALEKALVERGRKVLELDLPGHGTGSKSHDPADYTNISEQLDAALPGDSPLDAVGFSLGGKLLLHIAAYRPGRIRRLVVGGVGENIFRPEAGAVVAEALLGEIPTDAPVALESVVERARASNNDVLALAAVIRRTSPPPSPEQIAAIDADTLLVVGADDGIAGSLDPLARALPAVRTMVIAGIGHLSTPSSPQFQTAAAEFILRPFGSTNPISQRR